MSEITQTLQPLLNVAKFTFFISKTSHGLQINYFNLYLIVKVSLFIFFSYCAFKVLFIFFIWPANGINVTNNTKILVTSFYIITTFISTIKNSVIFNKLLIETAKLDLELKLPEKYNQKLQYWIYSTFIVISIICIGFTVDNMSNYATLRKFALNLTWEMYIQAIIHVIYENIYDSNTGKNDSISV